MSNFITSPLGNKLTKKYNFNGVNRLALIQKDDIISYVADAEVTTISGLTLDAGVLFTEIFFTKDSCALEDQYSDDGKGNIFMNQTLKFSVISDDLAATNKILLSKSLVALIQDSNGDWTLAGITGTGLEATGAGKNKSTEQSTIDFTLAGKSLGFASNVAMADSAVNALITSV